MGTTIFPMPSGGPSDESHLMFPGGQRLYDERRLREVKKGKMKKVLKAAEGRTSVKGSKKTVVKASAGKNLAKEGKGGKKGPFGEAYKAVSAGSKGVRVSESRRLKESVSSDEMRQILTRAIDDMFPKPVNQLGVPVASDYSDRPYIKDVFPDDGLVVFERKHLLWGTKFKIDEDSGKAVLGKPQRVKAKYVPISA